MELLETVSDIELNEIANADAYVAIVAPENTLMAADIPAERLSARQGALREPHAPFLSDEKPWVGCYYPTMAAAQDAGMPLRSFEDFLYGAVLIDWQELGRKMEGIAVQFDAASQVRIVGPETDLTFSLEGREGKVDALGANMPGGEIFYSPVEDSAEGVISYSEYPACYLGHEVGGVRFRFEGGTIVDASADSDEEFLIGDARHRRGRAQARRVRDRLQPRHPAAHAQHALRREDGGHDPPRDRHRLPPARRA